MTIKRLIVLSFATALLAGCVSKSSYESLEMRTNAEREQLKKDIASLLTQRQDLEGQRAQLEQQIAGLRDETTRRSAEKTALEQQMAAMQEKVSETEKRAKEKDEELARLRGTYDSLVNDLKGEIARGEVKVTQMRDRLSVQMVEKVLFDSGRADIKPEGKEVLGKVGKVLRTVKDKQIRIEGYTDSMPISAALQSRFPTNWELSTQRATTVVRFLQEKGGVDGKFLSAVGYGPFRPLASNDTNEGRAENRRIEISLVPMDVKEALKDIR